MRISVIGLGKLGSPLAAVLASKGHDVIGVDLDATLVSRLSEGKAPVYEPHLQELIDSCRSRLQATTNYDEAVLPTSISFVVVPTLLFNKDQVCELFDQYIPGWRTDNNYLRYAISIPLEDIRGAHAKSKEALFHEIRQRTGISLDPAVFTMGFARRASTYKRANLLFQDRERLKRIARDVGPIQIVYAGKAHPRDEGGKKIIRDVFSGAGSVLDVIRTVYVENYDMHWGRLITSGVDIWLNTPMRPQEASGTSGMKAALNGVPSFSVVDGWWAEGWIEGVTGWAIGNAEVEEDPASEVSTLYDKLERQILPMFYGKSQRYTEVMRSAIALNGSFFNTQRMVQQYLANAYMLREVAPPMPRTKQAVPALTGE